MRIRHISFSSQGGAGKAAHRLASLQRSFGLDSEHIYLTESDLRSEPFAHPMTALLATVDALLIQRRDSRPTQFSALRNLIDNRIPAHISADVFHLHWPAGLWGSRSFELAQQQGVQVVQTLHDDFPFTGGCHNAGTCTQFETGCGRCPMVKLGFRNIPSASQVAKVQSLSIHRAVITAQSNWMLERALKSRVLKDARAFKIHNPISEVYSTGGINWKRNRGARGTALRIGFIAANVNDPNKGLDLAIRTLVASSLDFSLRVAGSYLPKTHMDSERVHFLGRMSSAQLVEEAKDWDFLLVNSINENAPTVISEMACLGVPTLSVDVGAISEMIAEYGLGATFPRNSSPGEFRSSALELKSMATEARRESLSARARLLHSAETLNQSYLNSYAPIL